MNIWFDMDGTIADLYGVNNWLDFLMNEDTTPYVEAKPLIPLNQLARQLNRLQTFGYTIGIISWTSRSCSEEYHERIVEAKKKWLSTHIKSVKWDSIDIVPYGTPKQEGREGILFDDEAPNRDNWEGIAFDEKNILEILKGL